MHSFPNKGHMDENTSPLDAVNTAQERALDLSRILRLMFAFVLLAWASMVAHFVLPNPRIVIGLGMVWCIVLVFLLGRGLRKLFSLRLSLGEIYLMHREKGHQTCGSMEPNETRAR